MRHVSKKEFARQITENRQRFYRIAYSYVKNEQEALDVVGEAVCKGLTHLKTLEDTAYFLTWMTRIVINTAIDSMKRNRRYTEYEDYMVETPGVIPVFEEELRFDLYAAMDVLKPEERSCIILKYFEEYSFREMADILEEPESTVKSRTYRALGRMKQHMEGGEVS